MHKNPNSSFILSLQALVVVNVWQVAG